VPYPIPAQQAEAEIEIKKSRFIAYAQGIQSREEGMKWLEQLREQYPDARHHCWAYLLGNPSCATNAGMGDDGEPSGTAGKPILNVLQHKGVGDIMIVVVRYFGGVKLGAGGLTRAYGQAAQAVMEILQTEQQVAMTELKVDCDFSQEQQIRHWLEQSQGEILNIEYQQRVTVIAIVPNSSLAGFEQSMQAMGCAFKTL
jgi:uncharacterized YigZ family protein